jgi:hypothetical protein
MAENQVGVWTSFFPGIGLPGPLNRPAGYPHIKIRLLNYPFKDER